MSEIMKTQIADLIAKWEKRRLECEDPQMTVSLASVAREVLSDLQTIQPPERSPLRNLIASDSGKPNSLRLV